MSGMEWFSAAAAALGLRSSYILSPVCVRPVIELYIPCWSQLSRRKLSPTSATAHYSSPDNVIGLVAQCKLSGYVKLG